MCQKAYQKANYQLHRQKYIEAQQVRNKAVDKELRRLRDEAKSKPCMDCCVAYPPWVMQFDHRPEEKKMGDVSTMVRSKSKRKLMLEISKCDVVCANCHAQRTHDRKQVP